MRKIISVILIFVVMLTCSSCASNEDNKENSQSGKTINVYNWGQYISNGEDGTMDLLDEFTKRTGIRVNYNVYDSNESMYTKLETGGSSIDIIIPSDYMIERLIKNNMLLELDFNKIPNFKFIDRKFKNLNYDPENKYSVPYTFGTVGIIYNTKYVTEKVDSWDILWNEKYKDKILMFDNPRDAFGIAQSKLGYDINNSTDKQLYNCYRALVQQKPVVQQYVMDQIFETMVSEEAWIAPYYAGDYFTMLEDNENLAFAHPKEGFNYFVDAVCIPKSSKNKAAAEEFINFLCDPEISAANMEYIGYSSPVTKAREYMDEEMANDPITYPSDEQLENAYMFKNLPDETLQYINELWLKVKVS